MSVFALSWKKCPRISNFLVLLWTVAAKRYVLFNNVMLLTRNISKYFAEKGNSYNLLLGLTWFESPSRDRQPFKHSCPLNFPCLWKLFSFKLKLYSILPIFIEYTYLALLFLATHVAVGVLVLNLSMQGMPMFFLVFAEGESLLISSFTFLLFSIRVNP